MKDRYGREIEYMRLSLTDRCNLRCKYCMPCDLPSIPHENILTYEEFLQICQAALALGIDCFKVTGGEPLVRKGCMDFIRTLKNMPGVRQVTLTTNGLLLEKYAGELSEAGVDGINVSLDTLDKSVYRNLTGKDALQEVLEGILSAYRLGLHIKINCVTLKGINEQELFSMVELARMQNIDVRFIEIMPVGFGKEFAGISMDMLRKEIVRRYPRGEIVTRRLGNGPASYYHPEGFAGSIGFIDAIHGKFCDKCNRVRVTSEGYLKTCLYYNHGISLRDILRSGGGMTQLQAQMRAAIWNKPMEHHFGKNDEESQDTRKMSQIGG